MTDPYASRNRYRNTMGRPDLSHFRVSMGETDLHIQAEKDLSEAATGAVAAARNALSSYISRHPDFATTLSPWPEDPHAPAMIREMIAAGNAAGVGPMAAVAGAVAQSTGKVLFQYTKEVFIENGGDLFVRTHAPVTIGLYAGDSPFTGKIGIRMETGPSGTGICTSSGAMGHSISFGRADAAVVVADCAAMADAFATAMANRIQSPHDVDRVLEEGREHREIRGMVLVKGDRFGAFGEIEIVRT